ncbi:MAG: hypothetical protein ACYC26_02865 [Phycisphaerales bacterium]
MTDLHDNILCPADQQVLDLLVDHGFEIDRLPPELSPELRPRAAKVLALMSVLDHLPDERPGDLLAERTLHRVAEIRKRERASQHHPGTHGLTTGAGDYSGGGGGMRWSDLITVAAMILISVSLAFPVLSRQRAQSRQAACQSNLAAAGMGFGQYAQQFNDQLPTLKTRPGDPWWHINSFNDDGSTQSNSAHVFLLIRNGYVQPTRFVCPGNVNAGAVRITIQMRDWPDARSIQFSNQNMFTEHRPTWGGKNNIAVLADKNPLFTSGQRLQGVPDDANSANHQSLNGQNVLTADGNVAWLQLPVINGQDNIWQAKDKTQYTGNETPADEDDSFLVH